MFATVASAASLSSQDLSKFTSGQSVRPARHVTIPEKDTKMNQTTVSTPTSPNRLKPKEKLIGFYDSLLQVYLGPCPVTFCIQ